VAEGTPEDVAAIALSYTGQVLAPVLARAGHDRRERLGPAPSRRSATKRGTGTQGSRRSGAVKADRAVKRAPGTTGTTGTTRRSRATGTAKVAGTPTTRAVGGKRRKAG